MLEPLKLSEFWILTFPVELDILLTVTVVGVDLIAPAATFFYWINIKKIFLPSFAFAVFSAASQTALFLFQT